ncbi:NAD-dependent succinate-semialdehyde dehydrogenase, partial [Kaarinaea lacus]
MKKLISINPATEEVCYETECWSGDQLQTVVNSVTSAAQTWANTPLTERIKVIRASGELLRSRCDELARLITTEMGKVITESYAEIGKCIHACEYYAENAQAFLAEEVINTDASRSYVAYQPLGTVLGIMPWNFPFWQVFRFAVPALMTGNTAMLKHASNVPQSALAAEQLLHDAGVPDDVFRSLMVHSSQIEPLLVDSRIQGIAVTGSERTGRSVAKRAGEHLKKLVLELGGSDAFIVLEDADIERAVNTAVASRFFTSGQSCINAKRIIVVKDIADRFVAQFYDAVNNVITGDPMDSRTKVGPLARKDLLDKLNKQVRQSISMGAEPLIGCYISKDKGFYYPPSILNNVSKGMPAYEEEIFGPVASIIYANNEQDAIRIANDSIYGLGGSVWTRNVERGERVARQIETGCVYVNGLVKSDPRLPFGGVKHSGYGRELCRHGMLEFANAKTIWLA